MSLSTSLTWTRTRPPPCTSHRTCPLPSPALRSIQAWSGLFDTSVTGDDLFSVAPEEKSLLTQKVAPLTSMLSDDGRMLQEMIAMFDSYPASPLLATDPLPLLSLTSKDGIATTPSPVSPGELLGGEEGMHFLEDFTNLSDYLFTSTTETSMDTTIVSVAPAVTLTEAAETSANVVSSTGRETRKRKASPAVSDGVLLTPEIPDHCDYICKKPRWAAVPTTSVSTTETDSAAATNSMQVPLNKDARYRERRTKNNIASRRSRETRKQKYSAMETREIQLEASNTELEKRIEELEELATKMKDVLVKRLSQAGSAH